MCFSHFSQLNATLEAPEHCYDNKILKQLPGQLIVFGRINTNNNNNNFTNKTQILILPNGLIPWSQEIENEIWKKLGKFIFSFYQELYT